MDGFEIRQNLESRGIELILVGGDLVVRPVERLTAQDRELVASHREKVVFACQVRDGSTPVSRLPKVIPDPSSPEVWCVPRKVGNFAPSAEPLAWRPPTNSNGQSGKPTVPLPIDTVVPAGGAYDDKPAGTLVEESIVHLKAWRGGGTSASRARALAHLALVKLTAAVAACERDASFQIDVSIDAVIVH